MVKMADFSNGAVFHAKIKLNVPSRTYETRLNGF